MAAVLMLLVVNTGHMIFSFSNLGPNIRADVKDEVVLLESQAASAGLRGA